MKMSNVLFICLFSILGGLCLAHNAQAAQTPTPPGHECWTEGNLENPILYQTGCPDSGDFGLIGFDLYESLDVSDEYRKQEVAIRFIPQENVHLTHVRFWLMNNSYNFLPAMSVQLRGVDKNHLPVELPIPPENILAQWDIDAIQAHGWNPEMETILVEKNILLKKGHHYWFVLASEAPIHYDPVWNMGSGYGFVSIKQGNEPWYRGSETNTAPSFELRGKK